MRKRISYVAISAMIAMAHSASATYISQVVTSAGGTGSTAITTNATLTSFAAGGTTYSSFIGIGVADPTPAARIWGTDLSDPGSDTAAVSDLDLATGTLNNGTDAVYDLSGQTLTSGTTIFMFGNGNGGVAVDGNGDAINSGGTTPPGTVTFLDAAAGVLGSVSGDFFFQDPGINSVRAPNLLSFNFARSGNNLNGRTVSGAIFTLADITFTTGGIGDIAGFRISSANTDIQDVGIAAIPEPATLGIMAVFGGAVLFIRRRFMI